MTDYRYTTGGGDGITGALLDVEPRRSLVATFDGHWAPDVAALPTLTVTFLLDPDTPAVPDGTMLTCLHAGLVDTASAVDLERGRLGMLSGLKTLDETGRPLSPAPA